MKKHNRSARWAGLVSFFNQIVVTVLPFFPLSLVRFFASKYIAGEELSDAIRTAQYLNRNGIMTTIDVLGESISQRSEATEATRECVEVIEAINQHKLNSNISIKLTQLGMDLDMDFCFSNLKTIADAARKYNIFIRIDMEDSPCTDRTIELFLKTREYYSNCGIVLQAYMRRTEADAAKLNQTKTNYRLCKGIYIEPEAIAFKKFDEVNDNYLKVLRQMLSSKCYVGIATHDDALVDGSYKIIDELKLRKSEYEFQMLLGVREALRASILQKGHNIRVYVPFGKHWYKYSMRRFKENPSIAFYVVKAIVTRD